MTFKEFTQSSTFTKIITLIGGILVLLVIFQAGIFVGYRVASFSIHWDDSRNMNIRDPRSIFTPFSRDADDMNPHGAIGEIISVKLPEIMVKEPSGNESIILLSGTTSIRLARDAATSSDLRVGEQVITIGLPDELGQIRATFIRIMGSPPSTQSVPGKSGTGNIPTSI